MRARLDAARDAVELVELRRNIKRAERLNGYVAGIGKKWVLMAYLNFEEVKADLTRVEFGGPYEAALYAVAGDPPAHDDHDVTR